MDKDTKQFLDDLATDFEEFKRTHSNELEETKRRSEGPISETREKLERIEDALQKTEDRLEQINLLKRRLDDVEADEDRGRYGGKSSEDRELEHQHMKAFEDYIRSGGISMSAMSDLKSIEQKLSTKADITTTVGASGGFAVPEVIGRMVHERAIQSSPWLQIIEPITTGTSDYKELVDIQGETSAQAAETGARSATNSPQLAEAVPTWGMWYAYPQATEESVEDVFFNVADWIVRAASRKLRTDISNWIPNGSGTNEPTGFIGTPVATDDFGARAFGTIEFVASGDAALVTRDSLVDLVHTLEDEYLDDARWAFNKTMLGTIRKFKTDSATVGAYLWEPGFGDAGPTLMGYPYIRAAHMPAEAANAHPVAFGDFNEAYMLVNRPGLRITRDEVTTPGYVKWYVRQRWGGILRNDEAIKVIKCTL